MTIAVLIPTAYSNAARTSTLKYAPPTSYWRYMTPAARAFREETWRTHPCLAEIIDRYENGWWDPTRSYHNTKNVNEAYGLGQATPGTKMAPYGPDWRTSRATQLRWMIAYTRSKFGSECAALAARRGGMY